MTSNVESRCRSFHFQPLSMEDVSMAQFRLLSWSHGTSTNVTKRKIESGFRTDSIAFLHFKFERLTGYFILQVRNSSLYAECFHLSGRIGLVTDIHTSVAHGHVLVGRLLDRQDRRPRYLEVSALSIHVQ